MGLQSIEKTDDMRRLALQLALQLPESVSDARRVLAMTAECLDEFLIEKGASLTPWQRARRLGWRIGGAAPEPAVAAVREDAVSAPRALCCALGTLFVSAPLAMLLVSMVGNGAGFCFGFAVILVSMVFGAVPAFALACVSPIVHNLVVVPPAMGLQAPSEQELVWAAFYVLFALIGAPLARRLDRLRRLARRPLKVSG